MMTHEAPESQAPKGRSGFHRLLPTVGATLVGVAVLAHLAGGAALLHLGPGSLANLGGGALVIAIAALVSVKLLMVFGARHWLRRR
jgi:hypothetical protein